jgi:preprotein translocase subunit SecY
MIVFFAYFYTLNVSFKVDDVAENLKNQNAFGSRHPPRQEDRGISGICGQPHSCPWAAYLTAVCLLPEILISRVGDVPFYFGGTSVLIVVSVTMDTIQQVQSHLLAHQYEALIEKSQLRGRKKSTAPKAPARR